MNSAARIGNRINQNRARCVANANSSAAGVNNRRKMLINSKRALENRLRKKHGYKMEYDSDKNMVNVSGETNAFQRIMISELFK